MTCYHAITIFKTFKYYSLNFNKFSLKKCPEKTGQAQK
jgi:hypothetical protein